MMNTKRKGREGIMATPTKSQPPEEQALLDGAQASSSDECSGGAEKDIAPASSDATHSAPISRHLFSDTPTQSNHTPEKSPLTNITRRNTWSNLPTENEQSKERTPKDQRRHSAPPETQNTTDHVYKYIDDYANSMLTDDDIKVIRLMKFISDTPHADIKSFLSLRAYHYILFLKHLKITPCRELAFEWEKMLQKSIIDQLSTVEYDIGKCIIPVMPTSIDSSQTNKALLKRAKSHIKNHLIAKLINQVYGIYKKKEISLKQAKKLSQAIITDHEPCLDGLLPKKTIDTLEIHKYAKHSKETVSDFIKTPMERNTSLMQGVMNQLSFSPLLQSKNDSINRLSNSLSRSIQHLVKDLKNNTPLNFKQLQSTLSLLINERCKAVSHEDLVSNDLISEQLKATYLSVTGLLDKQTRVENTEASQALPINEDQVYEPAEFFTIAETALHSFLDENEKKLGVLEENLTSIAPETMNPENHDENLLTSINPSQTHPEVLTHFNNLKNKITKLSTHLFGNGLFSPPEERPNDTSIGEQLKDIFHHMLTLTANIAPYIRYSPEIITYLDKKTPKSSSIRDSVRVKRFYGKFVDTHCAPPAMKDESNLNDQERDKHREAFGKDKARGLRNEAFKLPSTWPVALLSLYLSHVLQSFIINQMPAGHQLSSSDDMAARPNPHILSLWATIFSNFLMRSRLVGNLPRKKRNELALNKRTAQLNEAIKEGSKKDSFPAPQTPSTSRAIILTNALTTNSPSPEDCPIKQEDIRISKKIESIKSSRWWKSLIGLGFVFGIIPGVIILLLYRCELSKWTQKLSVCRQKRMTTPQKRLTPISIMADLAALQGPNEPKDTSGKPSEIGIPGALVQ